MSQQNIFIVENKEVDIYLFASAWVKKQMKSFSSDDLREAYILHKKLPKDTTLPFGGVFGTLSREKLIKENGSTNSRRKEARGRKITVWISKEYSQSQQAKREHEDTRKARELSQNQTEMFTKK